MNKHNSIGTKVIKYYPRHSKPLYYGINPLTRLINIDLTLP